MALDELLLREVQHPVLRFYFASQPSLSVGYSTHPGNIANPQNLPVCRRLTGGGAVEHGRDLLFSLAADKMDDVSFASVRLSYLKIHEAVKWGLEALGKKPRFYRCDESLPRGSDCFAFPIASDLALDGRKIAGGAQKRSAGRLLHQESVKIPPGADAEALILQIQKGFQHIFKMEGTSVEMDPEWFLRAKRLAAEHYEQPLAAAGPDAAEPALLMQA